MGFDDLDDEGDGGFTLYDKGENVYLKLSQIIPKENNYYDSTKEDSDPKNKYEVELRFDSVSQNGNNHGEIAWYPTAKITVKESETHTSHAAKILLEAGVLEDVLEELGADEETIELVKDGERTWYAESMEECEQLGKLFASHLKDVVFRAGTSVVETDEGDNYSRVDQIYEKKESGTFDERVEDISDSSEEDDVEAEGDDSDVIFGEDDEDEEK